MKTILLSCLMWLSFSIYASPIDHPTHVIYITIDGLAPYELTPEKLPTMFKRLVPVGELIGAAHDKRSMTVGTIPVSLPSYFSQMTGVPTFCLNNECARVPFETLPEKLLHQHSLDKYQVATIASWPPIAVAAEHKKGTTYVNAGTQWHDLPFYDQYSENQLAKIKPGLKAKTRQDKQTFEIAMHYLKNQQPRFLWLSLDETDKYAHAGDRKNFKLALSHFDGYLNQLSDYLANSPHYQNTWVVISSDHGRGKGKNWIKHGTLYPASYNSWLLVFHSSSLSSGKKVRSPYDLHGKHYSTLSIKPMIERLMKN